MQKLKISEVRDINQYNKEIFQRLAEFLGSDWQIRYTFKIEVEGLRKKTRHVDILMKNANVVQGIRLTEKMKFKKFEFHEIGTCIENRIAKYSALKSNFKTQLERLNEGFQKFKEIIELKDKLQSELAVKAKEKTTKIKI
jgi:uncharacterized alpha-E superfamily protein